jgi:spore germination protein YaaH
MTQRSRQLPSNRRPGLYNGRSGPNYMRLGMMALIVLGAIALLWFLFTKACGGDDCPSSKYFCVSDQEIKTPQGFERVSKIFTFNTKREKPSSDNAVAVQVPLTKSTTDSRNLSFYRYNKGSDTWEPITPAILEPSGSAVSATFTEAPDVMAVMKRLSVAGHIITYLKHNEPLHRDAAGKVTIVHTVDFKPASDGGITGDLSTTVKRDATKSFLLYPTIAVSAADKGTIPSITGILSNAQSRSGHVQKIAAKVADLQLPGVDIAYLDLPADQRLSFSLFIAELAQTLHTQNKILTLTLPMPVRVNDRFDDTAYDWAELGKSADILQVAPYRDQSLYRLEVPKVLDYLVGLVSPDKLVLTVTPLAAEKAQDGTIATHSLVEAMGIATKLGIQSGADNKILTNANYDVVGVNINKSDGLTGLVWSSECACVAFTYKQAGSGTRTVWIENFFSVGFKLEFVTRYKLGGVAIEDGSENDTQSLGNIWTAIGPFATSGQPVLLQPNGADLTPKWRASKGTVEGGQRGTVKWTTPPEPGNYTVTLILSDGVASFESEIPVNVQARDTATPRASATP